MFNVKIEISIFIVLTFGSSIVESKKCYSDHNSVVNFHTNNSCDVVDFFVQNSTKIVQENSLNNSIVEKINIFQTWNSFPSNFIPTDNVSEKCAVDTKKLFADVQDLKLWALKMLDSSAKLPSGILNGNINQFGDFDQCLSIKEPVKGKYCLAMIDVSFKWNYFPVELDSLIHSHHWVSSNLTDPGHRVPKVSTIQWGICLPASCSADELQTKLKTSFETIKVLVDEKLCVSSDTENTHQPGKNITILLLGTVIFCTVIGSILDTEDGKNEQRIFNRLTTQFSLKKNVKALLETSSVDDVSGLDGIRALNALGLLISHKSFALFYNPYINRTQMAEMFGKPWAIIGRTAIVYTDSFLLISGFLTARCLLKDLQHYNKMRFSKKLVNRIFRIIPGLLTVILFCTYILPDLGNGPQWETVINEHSRLCKQNMWKNLMFIHNFMGFENMCLTHTHQLGIDMQLFFVAPLAVGLLWYFGTRGIKILIGVSVVSTVFRFVAAITKELSMIVYFGMPVRRFFDSANYSYILPSHRATIYIMGILLAYYMSQNQSKINLTKLQTTFGWSVATFLGLSALIGPRHIALLNYKYNSTEAAYYSAFAPIIWGAFISWSIWTCNNGCAGIFGKFMSWRGFKIFTKIAYAVYLTQFPIFFYNVGTQRHSDFYRMQMMIDVPELCAILIASTILTLLIEIPFNNIHKMLFKSVLY